MKPITLLKTAGHALYGDRWLMRISRDLTISDDALSRWVAGRTDLPASHEVLTRLAKFLRKKAEELANIADEIDKLSR